MEDRIVKFYGQIEESRLDQLKTSLNNLGVQFSVQKQLTFEDLGLAQVETTNAIPPPQQQQQTQQKVQIVRSNDCKSQVRGILPGQQLVQMPDGKLQIFSQPRTVQPKQQLEPVQQQQQKVQIVRSNDGKIRARGLLPGQLLVQMPDGKLQIFSQQQHPHVQQQLQVQYIIFFCMKVFDLINFKLKYHLKTLGLVSLVALVHRFDMSNICINHFKCACLKKLVAPSS